MAPLLLLLELLERALPLLLLRLLPRERASPEDLLLPLDRASPEDLLDPRERTLPEEDLPTVPRDLTFAEDPRRSTLPELRAVASRRVLLTPRRSDALRLLRSASRCRSATSTRERMLFPTADLFEVLESTDREATAPDLLLTEVLVARVTLAG